MTYQDLEFCSMMGDSLRLKNPNGELADVERLCRVQKSRATISRAAYPCHRRPPAQT
jgi:hypothetical protein